MQGRQIGERRNAGADFRSDPHGGRELAAVNHPVSHRRQYGSLLFAQVSYETLHRLGMPSPGDIL
jgi:hypothetical protein